MNVFFYAMIDLIFLESSYSSSRANTLGCRSFLRFHGVTAH